MGRDEREEREDRSTEREREREREENIGKKIDEIVKNILICVCGRVKWFEEGERARLKGGDHTCFYFLTDDNNVDVDSVSAETVTDGAAFL